MARMSFLLVAIVPLASAFGHGSAPKHTELSASAPVTLSTIVVHNYKADCGIVRHPAALSQIHSKVEPFQQVYKDGFYEVDCVKDYMHEHGDKFGDGKFAYEGASTSHVSIVHYSELVKGEDQEAMTHEVCYMFCRTLPDMNFFGLVNGRDCYCTPYYQPMESDSSACDEVCDGDKSTFCGGKSKSLIFQMHQCSDAQEDVSEVKEKIGDVLVVLNQLITDAKDVSANMQAAADALQTAFSKVGDVAASGLLQSAKVTAGKLEAAGKEGSDIATSLSDLQTSASALAAGPVASADAINNAEQVISDAEVAITRGTIITGTLTKAVQAAKPAETGKTSAAEYYPVMYFVDQAFVNAPSTCAGPAAQAPMVSSFDACSAACDATSGCAGFNHMKADDRGLCFLLTGFESATYYTGCVPVGSFLEAKSNFTKAGLEAKCMAKFADFEGTSLKPDPSGKCVRCMKTLTKADRCFA